MDEEFADEKGEADDENDDPFHAGKAGDVTAEEVEEKGDDGNDGGHDDAGTLDFNIEADDADEEEDGADGVDERAEFFRAGGGDGGANGVAVADVVEQG